MRRAALILAVLGLPLAAAADVVSVAGPVYSVQMTRDASTAVQIGTVAAGKPCIEGQFAQTLGRASPLYLIPVASVTLFPGIDATAVYAACVPAAPPPAGGSATLSWPAPTQNTDGTPLTNLAGYRVFWGLSPSDLTNMEQVGADQTSYVVTGLAPATYYFAVSAVNSAGAESARTNPATKTVQ